MSVINGTVKSIWLKVGRILRKARQKQALTLVEMATRLGLDHSDLSKMERGQRSVLRKRIADFVDHYKLEGEDADYVQRSWSPAFPEQRCPPTPQQESPSKPTIGNVVDGFLKLSPEDQVACIRMLNALAEEEKGS